MLFRRRRAGEATPVRLLWRSDRRFEIGPLRFDLLLDAPLPAHSDAIVILKERATLTRLLDVLAREHPRRAFEFGIFRGGSALMWTTALGLERMAALDHGDPVPQLDQIIRQQGLQERVKLFYGRSQADRAAVQAILAELFGAGDLDLVIDDASHLYQETKASFEIAFPFLRPGGLYVIEDWGWAHWPGYANPGFEGPALSNLVIELVLAAASSPEIIAEVVVW